MKGDKDVFEDYADEAAEYVQDLFMAAGAGDQRLYIIPSLDMVTVRQAVFGRWDDREFIARLLTAKFK